jgi:hypothetical protein
VDLETKAAVAAVVKFCTPLTCYKFRQTQRKHCLLELAAQPQLLGQISRAIKAHNQSLIQLLHTVVARVDRVVHTAALSITEHQVAQLVVLTDLVLIHY